MRPSRRAPGIVLGTATLAGIAASAAVCAVAVCAVAAPPAAVAAAGLVAAASVFLLGRAADGPRPQRSPCSAC